MPTKQATRPSSSSKPSSTPSKGPSAGFAHRLKRLRGDGASRGLSAVLITNPKDVGYLTGFHGGDSYLAVPCDAKGKPVILSDFRYQEELEPVRSIADIYIRSGSMREAVVEVLARGAGDVGVQAEQMTIGEHRALSQALGTRKIVACDGLLTRQRAIKDDTEIALIQRAIRIQQGALKAVLPTIEPGQSELEIAARLEAEMKRRGSSEPGFNSIVAAGANGSLPHYRPQKAKVRAGSPLLIDWGAVVGGYHGDMTRTFAIGGWEAKGNRKIAEIYRIVLEAHERSAAALAPGKTTKEIDAIARDHIARAGYAEFFGHGLGHGIGLNGHEDPRLTHMLAGTPLEPGMVVTIEPGIYLPGVGGVRIEDDFLITAGGARNLCSMPKSLSWASR